MLSVVLLPPPPPLLLLSTTLVVEKERPTLKSSPPLPAAAAAVETSEMETDGEGLGDRRILEAIEKRMPAPTSCEAWMAAAGEADEREDACTSSSSVFDSSAYDDARTSSDATAGGSTSTLSHRREKPPFRRRDRWAGDMPAARSGEIGTASQPERERSRGERAASGEASGCAADKDKPACGCRPPADTRCAGAAAEAAFTSTAAVPWEGKSEEVRPPRGGIPTARRASGSSATDADAGERTPTEEGMVYNGCLFPPGGHGASTAAATAAGGNERGRAAAIAAHEGPHGVWAVSDGVASWQKTDAGSAMSGRSTSCTDAESSDDAPEQSDSRSESLSLSGQTTGGAAGRPVRRIRRRCASLSPPSTPSRSSTLPLSLLPMPLRLVPRPAGRRRPLRDENATDAAAADDDGDVKSVLSVRTRPSVAGLAMLAAASALAAPAPSPLARSEPPPLRGGAPHPRSSTPPVAAFLAARATVMAGPTPPRSGATPPTRPECRPLGRGGPLNDGDNNGSRRPRRCARQADVS